MYILRYKYVLICLTVRLTRNIFFKFDEFFFSSKQINLGVSKYFFLDKDEYANDSTYLNYFANYSYLLVLRIGSGQNPTQNLAQLNLTRIIITGPKQNQKPVTRPIHIITDTYNKLKIIIMTTKLNSILLHESCYYEKRLKIKVCRKMTF